MAGTEEEHQPQMKEEKINFSVSIWPPTQRTRDAVIQRLIETLSTPSVLSKRYGSIPAEEALASARLIEEEAFSLVSRSDHNSSAADSDEVGIEILQIYSKEISKRMLEVVKSKAASASPSDNSQTPHITSEEISSLESESSQT
ncbi:MFP1 attachment factor 1-like [Tasmannia lanceolata]|uniref:MFP1 attachment factor 1-like n=1 Tax=Tasmannia lanceolata TaxID=3420 RepID=UPI0040641677